MAELRNPRPRARKPTSSTVSLISPILRSVAPIIAGINKRKDTRHLVVYGDPGATLTVVAVSAGTVYKTVVVVADGSNWPKTLIESATRCSH